MSADLGSDISKISCLREPLYLHYKLKNLFIYLLVSFYMFLCNFLLRSLVFSDTVHDGSWSWDLVTDKARFLEKNLANRIWAIYRPKWDPKLGFCHFLKYGSLVFREIAYNNSVQQCVTSKRVKIHGKIFLGSHMGQKGTCNKATLKAKFRNGVGSIPVGGNSPSVGGWIVWTLVIQH